MLFSDAKEIDPSDIQMKERLGAGQFGVSFFVRFSDNFLYLLSVFSHQCRCASVEKIVDSYPGDSFQSF